MATRMVIDTSNLLFRVASMTDRKGSEPSSAFETDEQKAGFMLHVALNSMLKYYKKYKPAEMCLAFEGRKNWRKAYTAEHCNVLPKAYKANRVYDSSRQHFFELIESFKELVQNHTSIVTLSKEGLEGDDMIAGYAQRYANQGDDVYVISGDRDFMQLYRNPKIRVIDPASGKDRIAGEKDFDANFFIFEKCFRGDPGDNVMTAYPRVRTTALKKAYTDPYALEQLMKHEWSVTHLDEETGEEKVYNFVVGDLFKHNEVLMDLEKQPAHVRESLEQAIDDAHTNVGKFNHFQFMKFLGKHELKAIAEKADIYAEMFSMTGKAARKETTSVKADMGSVVSAADFLKGRKKTATVSADESDVFEF